MIKTFNTGRGYSPQGQRIAYMVLAVAGSEALVAMVDVDRDINYVLDVQWPHGDREVMEAYDKGCVSRGFWMPQAVKDALQTAAEGGAV